MIQDLHSHTYYSFCGGDRPEEVADAALAGGIEVLGITDHNYGVGYGRFDVFCCPCAESLHGTYERTLRRYYDHINLLREKYRGKIEIKRGIELCTLYDGQGFKKHHLPESEDISYFDYCLIEKSRSSDLRHARRSVLIRKAVRYADSRHSAYGYVFVYQGERRRPVRVFLQDGRGEYILGDERKLRPDA